MAQADTPWYPWTPFSMLADTMVAAGDALLKAAPTVRERPLNPAQLILPKLGRVQQMGEAAYEMLSPMIVNAGAVGMKLGEMAYRHARRNFEFATQWLPLPTLALGSPDAPRAMPWPFSAWSLPTAWGPPSAWPQAPVEAATRALADTVQQGQALADSGTRAARTTLAASERTAQRAGAQAQAGIKRAARSTATVMKKAARKSAANAAATSTQAPHRKSATPKAAPRKGSARKAAAPRQAAHARATKRGR